VEITSRGCEAMKSMYKTFENGLKKIEAFEDGAWLRLVNPTPQEINETADEFNIEVNHILSALDEEERARIEEDDNCTVIIVDMPIQESEEGFGNYATIPMTIIIGDKFIITICLKNIQILDDFSSGKIKGFFTYKKTRFILQILYKNASYFLQYLRLIDRMSHRIEQELHKSMKNKELIHLLDLQKSLVYFTTSLRANEIVLEKMMRMENVKQYPEDEDLLEDVIIENKQAIEMANIYSNILNGTMDAFSSVISNNLNIVMKTLTSITVIIAIPTMLGSFWGMNVQVPMHSNPYAFYYIIIASVGLTAILTLILIGKKLF